MGKPPAVTTERSASLFAMLVLQRSTLVSQLKAIRATIRQLAETHCTVGDAVDKIDFETELSAISGRANTLATQLAEIDIALQRLLNDDSYGTCSRCGDQIAEARLRAIPSAKRCRVCQERHEDANGVSSRIVATRSL